MSAPLKTELKASLKKLWLSEFAEQYVIQGALAASEGWSYWLRQSLTDRLASADGQLGGQMPSCHLNSASRYI